MLAVVSALGLTAVLAGGLAATYLWGEVETFRKSSESKSVQLTQAIDRLFTAVAESPTIRLGEADPLREKLLLEARAMYDQLIENDGTPGLQLERKRSIFRLAKLNHLLGNTEHALELAERCVEGDVAEQLVYRGKLSIDEFADWHCLAAELLNDLGRFDEADERYSMVLAVAGIDVAGDLQSVSLEVARPLRIVVAFVLSKRANDRYEAGTFNEADELSKAAMRIWEELPAGEIHKRSDCRYYQACCLLVRGRILEKKGQLESSRKMCEQARQLISPLAMEGVVERMHAKERLVQILLQLGIAQARGNRFDDARLSYAQAIELLQVMVLHDPRVIRYTELLCSVRYSLAVTEMLCKDFPAAENLIAENLSVLRDRVESGIGDEAIVSKQIANNYSILSVIRIRSPNCSLESAAEAAESSIEFLQVASHARPEWNHLKIDLGRATHTLADIRLQNDDYDAAIVGYREAIAQMQFVLESQPMWEEAKEAMELSKGALQHALDLSKQPSE